MNATRNATNYRSISTEMGSLINEMRSCNEMKYSRYYRELLETLPTASALRLLRAHLQRDPRYVGREISEDHVLMVYESLVPLSVRQHNRSIPDPAEQLKPKK